MSFALAGAGFFHAGGLLVGTHVFMGYQNYLGVQWHDGAQTLDLDFAHAGKNVSIAIPSDVRMGILVNAPPPEKYAVHKLLVHGERPQNMRIKAGRDLIQAAALIEYLAENDAQALQDAWLDLTGRGPGWFSRATEGLTALKKAFPQLNTAPLVL